MKQFFIFVAVALAATHSLLAQMPDSIATDWNVKSLIIEQLPEVVVIPAKTWERHYGRLSNSGPLIISTDGENAIGKEFGLKFKAKNPARITQVSFAITQNDSMLIRMPFRLNLYKKINGEKYANNFVSSTEFLYTDDTLVDGRFTFILPEPWPIDKGEYVIAIEFRESFPDRKFLMPTNIMTGTTLYRHSPLEPWQKIPLGSTLAIKVTETEN